MSSIANGSVQIQTSSESQFATPSWLGEVAVMASHLRTQGILNKICERMHFARRHQRRACLRLHRQHLEVQMEPALKRTASSAPTISRAQRAHYRLSWGERLARNARTETAERITLTLFGIPDRLATFLGLTTA